MSKLTVDEKEIECHKKAINSKIMLFMRVSLITIVGFALYSCAAVGVLPTSNPMTKLHSAYRMMDEGRFRRADQFTKEASEIFEKQGDQLGIAEAYHTYGNLYKNGHQWNYLYDLEKSKVYFERARELFERNKDYLGVAKSLFGMGNAVHYENPTEACQHYRESLKAYEMAMSEKRNPAIPMAINQNYKDFPEMVKAFQKEIGCE